MKVLSCCFGTNSASAEPTAEVAPSAEKPIQSVPVAVKPAEMATKKVYIIYYSMYGHIAAMARAVKKGVDSVEGVEGVLYQVAETLPAEVLEKMHAPAKAEDVPIADPHTIDQADGFVFGFPTRFGMMCAQMKAFFDATGGHWAKGALAGKAASMFTSTASQGSGQETTLMTAVTQLAHHGMIYVPTGYGAGGNMFTLDEVKGGGPWGAGTFAGPTGARNPSEMELEQAEYEGKNLATVVKKLTA
jgi:NAD(P)H dehydrogenase (quinone)